MQGALSGVGGRDEALAKKQDTASCAGQRCRPSRLEKRVSGFGVLQQNSLRGPGSVASESSL